MTRSMMMRLMMGGLTINDVQVADDNEVAVGVGLPLAVQVDGTQLSYEPLPGFFSSHKITIFVS